MGIWGGEKHSEEYWDKKDAELRAQMTSPELTGDLMIDQGYAGGPGKLYKGPAPFSGHQTAQATAQAPGAQQWQQAALQNARTDAGTGWSGIDALAQQQAQGQSNRGVRDQRLSAWQASAAQGQMQGGAALRGALQAQQTGNDQSTFGGQQLAAQSADRRGAANQSQINMGAQMGQEAQQRAASNDAFNQWATGMKNSETDTLRANDLRRRGAEQDDDLQTLNRVSQVLG